MSLPFDKKLGENLKDLDNRVKSRKASLLLIDGGIGEGKTTIAVHVADYINSLHGLPEIDLKEKTQIAYGGEDFLKKLRLCYYAKLPVLIYDEAGDFNRRGALTRFNSMINRTFETFRAFQIIVILALPSFHVLDSDLFDKQIPRLLLHLYDRGPSWGRFKGYSLYRMRYVKRRMEKLIVPTFAFSIVEPNFYGQFRDLPINRSKLLDMISTKEKIKALATSEIKIKGLYSYTELGKKLGRSTIWVRKKVADMKLKHQDIINKAKYFDEGVLNRLTEEVD